MFTFQFLKDKIYSYSNKGYLTLGNLAKLLITHILFELQPIIIFSPVANFGDQSIVKEPSQITKAELPQVETDHQNLRLV